MGNNGNGKKNGKKSTALAEIGGKKFAIMRSDPAKVTEIICENVGDEGITAFDLDRVHIPPGGGQAWTVPGLDEDEIVKKFEGVIIFHKMGRVYWSTGMEEGGGGSPPDCSSDDCKTGTGEPGGACARCAFAQFESAENGRGQACKQLKQLFVMRSNSLLPLCISLPPTSLGAAKKYLLRLAGQALHYSSVLTRFGLEKTNNGSGIEYSRAVLTVAERLSEEQAARFRTISEQLRPQLRQVRVSEADYKTDDIPI